ncbi:MAG TPA: methionyl-tRNA formyltransferase [Verrucomicrobiota bacterium]|nr:methionyl-tRNA formyltransferase [Verrucomicrobiota bacterium]
MQTLPTNSGPLRCLFFGTAPLACPSLAALVQNSAFSVLGVVTQPDRPQGRQLKLRPSPVKELAIRCGLPVWQPEKCRDPHFIDTVRSAKPDVIVVAAYGQILPPALLEIPTYGCVNVHASLLPRHRGAAPIQWALLEGDQKTGVTIMLMDAGLDTGPILSQGETPILDSDDALTLHDRLAEMGALLLVQTLPEYVAGRIKPRPQPAEGATHARKITKEDGRIQWQQPAVSIWRRVRALVPWPGTYTYTSATPKPLLLKVWRANVSPEVSGPPGTVLVVGRDGILVACGADGLCITELQIEGGRRMSAAEFIAGRRLWPGQVLGP